LQSTPRASSAPSTASRTRPAQPAARRTPGGPCVQVASKILQLYGSHAVPRLVSVLPIRLNEGVLCCFVQGSHGRLASMVRKGVADR
jgi:hypothetical protein